MKTYPEKRLSRPQTGYDLDQIADPRARPQEELTAKLDLILIGMMLSGDALTMYQVALRMATETATTASRYTDRQLRARHYERCVKAGVTRWRYYAAMPGIAKAIQAVLG